MKSRDFSHSSKRFGDVEKSGKKKNSNATSRLRSLVQGSQRLRRSGCSFGSMLARARVLHQRQDGGEQSEVAEDASDELS
jgi:hypothetical protein